MEAPKIQDLDLFLKKIFPKKKIFDDIKIKRLNSPGDNYASLILAIDVSVENENCEKEVIHIVAKILPPNEFMKEFMNVDFTVRNELGFYEIIIPTLKQFRLELTGEEGFDFIPKFYGGRLNLHGDNSKVDDDSLIILENLKFENYNLRDKNLGYNLEETKLMLAKMAELHGSVIALKETRPQVFTKLVPFFDQFRVFQIEENRIDFATSDTVINGVFEIVEKDEFCASNIDKIKSAIKKCSENLNCPKNIPKFQQDTFASLVHNDLWINNILVKPETRMIDEVKFLDWQLYEFSSVTKDILFFLTSCAEQTVFEEHFNDLIKFYFDCLLSNLKSLKCDLTKFTFHEFDQEFRKVTGQVTYLYILGALPSMFATGDKVVDVDEISKEKLLGQIETTEYCKNRIRSLTKKLIQNEWL